jgi:hypothetical protein
MVNSLVGVYGNHKVFKVLNESTCDEAFCINLYQYKLGLDVTKLYHKIH